MGLICTNGRRLVYHLFLVQPDSDAPCHIDDGHCVCNSIQHLHRVQRNSMDSLAPLRSVHRTRHRLGVHRTSSSLSPPHPFTLANSLLLKGSVLHRLTKLLRNPPLRERPLPLPIRVILVLRPSNALPLPRLSVLVQSVEVYI